MLVSCWSWMIWLFIVVNVEKITCQFMECLRWLLVYWEVGNWAVCYANQLQKWRLKSWFWTRLWIVQRVRLHMIIWLEALMIVKRFMNSQKGSVLMEFGCGYWKFCVLLYLILSLWCCRCAVLTVEIEHVDVATMEKLEQQGVDCQPKASTIRIIQVCLF